MDSEGQASLLSVSIRLWSEENHWQTNQEKPKLSPQTVTFPLMKSAAAVVSEP